MCVCGCLQMCMNLLVFCTYKSIHGCAYFIRSAWVVCFSAFINKDVHINVFVSASVCKNTWICMCVMLRWLPLQFQLQWQSADNEISSCFNQTLIKQWKITGECCVWTETLYVSLGLSSCSLYYETYHACVCVDMFFTPDPVWIPEFDPDCVNYFHPFI